MIYWWVGLQSRRTFGERVLSIFLTKIMAAIFDFNGSGRLGRERNLYQEGGWQSKIRGGVEMGPGGGGEDLECLLSYGSQLWELHGSVVRTQPTWKFSHTNLHVCQTGCFVFSLLNNLTPKSDKHLISPNGITPKSKSMVMGIKEMITSSKFSWLLGKFSLQVP